MGRTYDNIYPSWPHDPACRCCHPNDRPFCDCPCHRGPARADLAVLAARWDLDEGVPCDPPIRSVTRLPAPPIPPSRRAASAARSARKGATFPP